jgi:ketosteroid isomerase-like protein
MASRFPWPAVAAAAAFAAPAFAANETTVPTSLDTLVAAERAFSATSVEQGMRTAFVQNLADDGIVFRPGPVNGRESWRTRPNPKGTLIWTPSFAEISGALDLGFSSGPWEYRSEGDPTAYGHFVSVWRRELGGPWRVVLDHGVSYDQPETDLEHVEVRAGPVHAAPNMDHPTSGGMSFGASVFGGGGFGVGMGTTTGGTEQDDDWRRVQSETNNLMSAERSFGWYMSKKSVAKAYGDQAADDLRFYRDGREPSLGKDAAISAIGDGRRDRTWTSHGNGVAKSWDLGYSYGIVVERASQKAPPDTSSYVHLWRKDATGRWRLALHVETAFPRAK